MSKVVESVINIVNANKNTLDDAINLLVQQEEATISNKNTYVVWGNVNKRKGTLISIPGMGMVDVYIENGKLKVNADEMFKERATNLIKQKYTAAYIMKKMKARISYDSESHRIKLEVPL